MRLRKRDHDLFEALVTPQLESAYRFSYQLARNEADAEDLIQEACQQAFKKFHQFKRGTNFKAWLFRIIRNRHIDLLRRKKNEPAAVDLKRHLHTEQLAVEDDLEGGHNPLWMTRNAGAIDNRQVFFDLFGDEVNRFLAELPTEFQASLVLCDVEGFSYQEISEIMECPIGTVRSRISRARSYLKEKLYHYAKGLGYVKDSIS
jgi:RNA polymerase sigma factor (sigma-70 family)